MKQIKTLLNATIIAACCTFLGCASYLRTTPGELEADNKIYIGTREWVAAYSYPISEFQKKESNTEIIKIYLLGLIDMPLCLAFDTLLLPYTLPDAILAKKHEEHSKDNLKQNDAAKQSNN